MERKHQLLISKENPTKNMEAILFLQEAKIDAPLRIEPCSEPILVVDDLYRCIGSGEIVRYTRMYVKYGEATPRILPDHYGNRLN